MAQRRGVNSKPLSQPRSLLGDTTADDGHKGRREGSGGHSSTAHAVVAERRPCVSGDTESTCCVGPERLTGFWGGLRSPATVGPRHQFPTQPPRARDRRWRPHRAGRGQTDTRPCSTHGRPDRWQKGPRARPADTWGSSWHSLPHPDPRPWSGSRLTGQPTHSRIALCSGTRVPTAAEAGSRGRGRRLHLARLGLPAATSARAGPQAGAAPQPAETHTSPGERLSALCWAGRQARSGF